MKLNSRVVLIISAAILPLAVSVVEANPNTVMLDATSPYYTGLGGGEFTAYTLPNTFLGNYATVAKVSGGFETFCLETGVEFSAGTVYYYSLGYVTQPTPGDPTEGSGLALSQGAAYLYYEFGKGILSGFDYTPGAGRATDDNLLQAAIWAFQGGQSLGTYPSGVVGNPFYAEATNHLGSAAFDAYTGTSVQVLQLWTNPNDTGPAQNQIVLVPDGGLTVSLLGGALMGLQMLRRKISR
jgi:hypothetical protein